MNIKVFWLLINNYFLHKFSITTFGMNIFSWKNDWTDSCSRALSFHAIQYKFKILYSQWAFRISISFFEVVEFHCMLWNLFLYNCASLCYICWKLKCYESFKHDRIKKNILSIITGATERMRMICLNICLAGHFLLEYRL